MPSFLFLCFCFFLSSTSQATVPPSNQFSHVNEGEFGDYIVEYDASYRVLPIARTPFQLFFYNTTPGEFTLAVRMGLKRSEARRRFVWEANRGNPVGENATFSFGSDGNLVLAHSDHRVAWQSDTAGKGVVRFEMLPSGNMVLYDAKEKPIWESFDFATDTLLVYKGIFPSGEEVAVKRAPKKSKQGLEQFKSEVFLISKLQHRNVVKLYGCCIDEEEQMLIYEYLPYKSLDSLLFVDHEPCSEQPFLDWRKRLNIIVGIARGILYLHQDSRFRIIHRDLKTSNVLLGAELNPKISDFGMARVLEGDQVKGVTSRIGGTYGYMAPEYAYYGKFSVKSDVFSFGVMLLEIVTGKTIFSRFTQEEDHAAALSLIDYVWELWKAKRVEDIVDPSLVRVVSSTSTQRCIHIGMSCIEQDPVDRPDMQTVVVMLNSDTIPLPTLKCPAFVFAAKSIVEVRVAEECSINEMTYSDTLTR